MGELMEKIKDVLDLLKNTIQILHGLGSPIKIGLLLSIFACAVVWVVVAGVLEFTKKVKEKHEGLVSMEKKLPRFFAVLYGGKVRFFLLVIVILLFAIDWRDATTISPPSGVPKAPPAPTVTFIQQGDSTPAPKGPARQAPSISLTHQDPLNPQTIQYPWQKEKNLDKPGVTVIVTANGEIRHPAIIFKCSVPCIYAQGLGTSSWYAAHLVKDKSDDLLIAMQLDMPGKLTDGQQIEMEFRSRDDREVKIESLKLMPQ
jgi:hypothetical protein